MNQFYKPNIDQIAKSGSIPSDALPDSDKYWLKTQIVPTGDSVYYSIILKPNSFAANHIDKLNSKWLESEDGDLLLSSLRQIVGRLDKIKNDK